MIQGECAFCAREKLEGRVFYEDESRDWFAFLAAPYHVRGHTILAPRKRGEHCPVKFEDAAVETIGPALRKLDDFLRKCYGMEDILFVSARGDIRHFHVHLFPRWFVEEESWLKATGYKKAHLLEFLGSIERRGDFQALERSVENGWSPEELRDHITKEPLFEMDLTHLRELTSYKRCIFTNMRVRNNTEER